VHLKRNKHDAPAPDQPRKRRPFPKRSHIGATRRYLQLASAAKASKHSTAVAEKISGKCSTSMKAPFQVILLKAILHRSKKPDVTAVTLFFERLPVSRRACVCDGAYDRAPAHAVNS
jgi:hypothetical protein